MTTGSIELDKLAQGTLLGLAMTIWERIGVTDNLKLPEPFVWRSSVFCNGQFAFGMADIYTCELGSIFSASRHDSFTTEEIRTILKAMEVAEATIKARNQPN